MTLVVGIRCEQFALITADSRVTTLWPNRLPTYVDCCKKVFRISKKTIIGFCGDLFYIAEVLNTLALINQTAPELMSMESLFERLPSALKAGSQDFKERFGRIPYLGLIVAGMNSRGGFDMFSCETPDFCAQSIEINKVVIMGSGIPIIKRFSKDLERHLPNMSKPLKPFDEEEWEDFASSSTTWNISVVIGTFMEGELEESKISTVGRVFHTLFIDAQDISPIPYSIEKIIDIGETKIERKVIVGTKIGDRGEWIQYNEDGTEIKLISPVDLISNKKCLINNQTLNAAKK